MNRHPYLLALALASTTLIGFVGIMVVDGWPKRAWLIVAAAPVLFGLAAAARQARARRTLARPADRHAAEAGCA